MTPPPMITTRARLGSGALRTGRAPGSRPWDSGASTTSGPAGATPFLFSAFSLPSVIAKRPRSVFLLHIGQQPGVARAGKTARSDVESLHRPGPEVEVEVAGGVLDRAPECPAIPRHQPEKLGP